MKHISFWAKRNKVASRSILVAIHGSLILLAIFAGMRLAACDFNIAAFIYIPFSISYLLGMLLYPERKKQYAAAGRKRIYKIQKSCDFVLALSSFFLIVAFVASHFSEKYSAGWDTAMASQPGPARITNESSHLLPTENEKQSLTHKLTHSEKKALRHELKKELRQLLSASSKGSHESAGDVIGKILLIILTLALAAGLSYLVAALGCSIACSGAEGLAVIVVVFGLGGVITLSIVTIKAILHMGRKKKIEENGQQTETNPQMIQQH